MHVRKRLSFGSSGPMDMRVYVFSPAKPGCEALFLGSGWKGFHRQAEVPGTKVVSLCVAVGSTAVGSTAVGSTVLALEGGVPSCLLCGGHLSWVSEQASILHPLEGCLPSTP